MQGTDTSLTKSQKQGVVNLLNCCLSDFYLLLARTEQYRRNIPDARLRSLDELWQKQCEELAENVDRVIARIQVLEGYPAGTFQEFLQALNGPPDRLPSVPVMVQTLLWDREQIVRNLRNSVDFCMREYRDEGTADMLIGMMVRHTDMAWMLLPFLSRDVL